MAGSGTTGAVCRKHRRKCIISDISDEYLTLAEKRLGVKRLSKNIIREQLLEIA
jgi:DNA modification methylase